jgi:hypothetical protein
MILIGTVGSPYLSDFLAHPTVPRITVLIKIFKNLGLFKVLLSTFYVKINIFLYEPIKRLYLITKF